MAARILRTSHREVRIDGDRLMRSSSPPGRLPEENQPETSVRRRGGATPAAPRVALGDVLHIEQRDFEAKARGSLDLLDLAGRLAVLLDDTDDLGVVHNPGEYSNTLLLASMQLCIDNFRSVFG